MKVILIGAAGTIGSAIDDALSDDHDVVRVGRTSGDVQADITDPASIQTMYDTVGSFDAVVSAAGDARFKPFDELTDADFDYSLSSKLMGQVNLVRYGWDRLDPDRGGSFTLVTGVFTHNPIPGSVAYSTVNGGVESFAYAAHLELPDAIRVNVISPPWVSETLEAMDRDPSDGLPAATIARAFVDSVEGDASGQVLHATDYV